MQTSVLLIACLHGTDFREILKWSQWESAVLSENEHEVGAQIGQKSSGGGGKREGLPGIRASSPLILHCYMMQDCHD